MLYVLSSLIKVISNDKKVQLLSFSDYYFDEKSADYRIDLIMKR